MAPGDRLSGILVVALVVVAAILLIPVFLATALVLLAVGAVLFLVLYIRFRLAVRRVRNAAQTAYQEALRRQGSAPNRAGPPPGVLDAEFRVDETERKP